MASPTIIVLGSVNTDFVVRGHVLPRPGHTVSGGIFFQSPGGKGANQAVAAARAASRPVALIAAVGDDHLGRESLVRLAAEPHLCTEYIRTIANVSSGVALICVDAQGENMISVAPGANLHLRPDDVDGLPDELFRGARVLLTSLESPLETVIRILQRARRHQVTTILNPAPADLQIMDSGVLELVDLVTPNEHELAALTHLPLEDREEMLAAARVLQALGAAAVVVTRGAAGCVVLTDRPTWVEAVKVIPVDTTAAGDAFNGALAVCLSEGVSLIDAARWANCAAALCVTRRGAQPSLAQREAIEDLARRTFPQ
jgi:ribokinase